MLSILIPCQEDGFLLFPTLKSIFQNEFPPKEFETLLIHSDDVQISKNVDKFPVKIYSDAYTSQAQALNWGIEKARGDIICTTKPGCIVSSNWLAEIVRFFQHHPDVDGVGGPILPCWEYGTKIQKLASQIFHEEQGFPNSVVVPKLNDLQGLFHATNSAFRREVLESVKFDESFCYDYDFDVCFRMLRSGYRLVFDPEMKVRYIFPLSMRNLLNRYYCWGKDIIILRKKYSYQKGLKAYLSTPYTTFRSLLQPSWLISRKKMLRFVQHAAFNLGCMRTMAIRLKPTTT